MKCQYCDNHVPPSVNNCPSCGATVEQQQPMYQPAPQGYSTQQHPQQPYPQQMPYPAMPLAKSKTAFTLLGIFLGWLGIHNFYAGYTNRGLAQLLITVLSCTYLGIISWIWAIIDICTVTKDGQGRPFI